MVNGTTERFENENLISKNLAKRHQNSPFHNKMLKQSNLEIPAVISANCCTIKMSRSVDHHLQPILRQIPSYIDTNDFINKFFK